MHWGVLRPYSYFSAGTGLTKKERSEKMYGDYDFGWGRQRAIQMSREVEHNRLEARLAKARLSQGAGLEEAVSRPSMAARSAAAVMALFR
jgi:hypothetical protein